MNTTRAAPPKEIAPWGLVGQSPAMTPVWEWWDIARRCRDPLLILGETGTGKRTLGRALSGADSRCGTGSAPIHLMALTAEEQVRALADAWPPNHDDDFDRVEGPTIVLHEVQALIPALQHRLAVAVAEREGAAGPRLIATSSADLVELVSAGAFSKELYWRLQVLPIAIPPLRRRADDLALIIPSMLDQMRESGGPSLLGVVPAALAIMGRYRWPGNLHELRSVLRAAALSGGERMLGEGDLPSPIRDQAAGATVTAALGAATRDTLAREYVQQTLGETDSDTCELYEVVIKPIERELLEQVLHACDQKQVRAAEQLGMSRNTLHKKLKEFGLEK